jgi:hypothetical protein
MKSTFVLIRTIVFSLFIVMAWGLVSFVPFAQAAEQPDTLTTVPEETGIGSAKEADPIQNRGIRQIAQAPPYRCSAEAGVCLCVGAANCEQMKKPTPCKRQKFCSGQTASSPPPVQPQEVPQSLRRTVEGGLVICSCRSGP